MSIYLFPIKMGLLIFPILAIIFTIPYIISQYRRYGAMIMTRIAIVYSLILYLLCSYFMVLLPLPKEDIPRLVTTTQLIPFQFIRVLSKIHFSSIIDFVKNPYVYQSFFNILLTLPLGVYLRYYFKKSWYHAILYGFLISLSFELLQLTGILGIYQYPYRIFDVDDLILNTLGALIGFWMTPLFTHFLPSKDKLIELSYIKGMKVSFIRQFVALFIDCIVLTGMSLFLNHFFNIGIFQYLLIYACAVLFYFGLLMYLWQGQTIGKKVVRIALRNSQNQPPTYLECIKRYSVLLMLGYVVPHLIWDMISLASQVEIVYRYILLIEAFILVFIFIFFVFQVVIVLMIRHETILYEDFSDTHYISLVQKK